MTDVSPARIRKTVYTGVISDILIGALDDQTAVLSATMTRTVRGDTIVMPITAAGPALESVRDQLVEGNTVQFYGQMGQSAFVVLGPDLRRRTLVRLGLTVPARSERKVRTPEERKASRRAFFAARARNSKAA